MWTTKNQQPNQLKTSRPTTEEASSELIDATQTFMDHLHELRNRLMWIVGSLLVASTVAYQCRDQLVQLVVAPLHGSKLVYLNPGGGLTFVFTVCMYFGAIVTIPVVMYQLYKFLQPVIGKTSRRLMVGIISCSILLATIGLVFGYLLVIPGAMHFLAEFSSAAAVPSITTDSYLNFVIVHLFGMAALFQLPLVLFIADHVNPLPPGSLRKLQRWVIAGAVIAAAVISPTPDPVSFALVALPIIGIYEIGVLVVWLRRRPRAVSAKSVAKVKTTHVAKVSKAPKHVPTKSQAKTMRYHRNPEARPLDPIELPDEIIEALASRQEPKPEVIEHSEPGLKPEVVAQVQTPEPKPTLHHEPERVIVPVQHAPVNDTTVYQEPARINSLLDQELPGYTDITPAATKRHRSIDGFAIDSYKFAPTRLARPERTAVVVPSPRIVQVQRPVAPRLSVDGMMARAS